MLRRNIFANFFGTGYVLLLQFALLPIVLRYLGAEAFGLVGVYATLLAFASIVDGGLAPALGRELARLSVLDRGDELMRSTVRTLETLCIAVAACTALFAWFAAPYVSIYWLNTSKLSSETTVFCLRMMGMQIAFQLLLAFYSGGLNGLQRMSLSNGINAVLNTLRSVGVLLVLLVLHLPAEAFFAWQALVTGLTALVMAISLYRTLPAAGDGKFSQERFAACWKYAAGMVGITLATVGLTQTDKLILSKLLSLEEFGYYTIATSIAGAISRPASLIFAAILPRMTQLYEAKDFSGLGNIYLKSSRLIAWLSIPCAGVFWAFHLPLLTLYFSSAAIASRVGPLVAIVGVGSALNALMHTPYALTLAYGWTGFAIRQNVIATTLLVPSIYFGATWYGPIGAAWAWLMLNAAYVLVSVYLIHRKCLPDRLAAWYRLNALIVAVCVSIALILHCCFTAY